MNMANKQVRITDQEHQLILLIRAVGVDLDKITGIVADMVIRKVTTAPQPEPEPDPEQDRAARVISRTRGRRQP